LPGEKALIADVVDTAQKITARSQENFSYDILPLSLIRMQKKESVYHQFISVREKKNNSADGLADMPMNGGLQEVSPIVVLPIDSVMRFVSRANISEGQSDMQLCSGESPAETVWSEPSKACFLMRARFLVTYSSSESYVLCP
jgi:hypothetical protein